MIPLFIGFQEIVFILIIAVVVFGPKKIPEIARGLGQGIRAMREATDDIKREILETTEEAVPTKEIRETTKEITNDLNETKDEIEQTLGSVKRKF